MAQDERFSRERLDEIDRPKYTCRRCKRPAPRLIKCYWHTADHSGLCPACCQLANEHFDEKSWPPEPTQPWWTEDNAHELAEQARLEAMLPSERQRQQKAA